MKNQNHTTIRAIDYSIATLQQMKKDLMGANEKIKTELWAINSIVSSLTAHLLRECHIIITESARAGEADMRKNLIEIQKNCYDFIEQMIKID
jgi:hypothetical protein